MSPLSTSKLWNMAKEYSRDDICGLDIPYVSNHISCSSLGPAEQVFKFSHSNSIGFRNECSTFESVEMVMNKRGTLHGFSGTFETVLYKDIVLSTVPGRHSVGMYSWFPMVTSELLSFANFEY
jgi:type II protein arginine methyltransferase